MWYCKLFFLSACCLLKAQLGYAINGTNVCFGCSLPSVVLRCLIKLNECGCGVCCVCKAHGFLGFLFVVLHLLVPCQSQGEWCMMMCGLLSSCACCTSHLWKGNNFQFLGHGVWVCACHCLSSVMSCLLADFLHCPELFDVSNVV